MVTKMRFNSTANCYIVKTWMGRLIEENSQSGKYSNIKKDIDDGKQTKVHLQLRVYVVNPKKIICNKINIIFS